MNGAKLPAGEEKALAHNDRVVLGSEIFLFEMPGGEGEGREAKARPSGPTWTGLRLWLCHGAAACALARRPHMDGAALALARAALAALAAAARMGL